MRRFYKLYALLLVLGLVFQTTVAAQIATPDAKTGDDLKPELKENALKLLSTVTRETQQFRLPENRVRAAVLVADLIWKYDEPEARALFRKAYEELQNMVAAANLPEGIELVSAEKSKQYSIRYAIADLRKDYVLALAVHDPESALNALAALQLPPIDEYDPIKSDDLNLKITTAIAKKDPDKSYTVARGRLDANGVTYEFIQALKNTHKKDAPLAAKLARDVLAKVKNLKIRVQSADATGWTPVDAKTEVEFGQLTNLIDAASEINRRSSRRKTKKTVPLFSEAEMKELIEITAGAFLAERNPVQYTIGQVMREVTRYSPPMAQRIRLKIGAEGSQLMDRQIESNSFYNDTKEKNADELAKIAEVSAPEARDARFSTAAFKALEEGQPEKARAIAERIKERKNYRYIFEQIQIATPLIKARRGDIGEVRRSIATLKTNEERVAVLSELAEAFALKGEKETAKALLEESLQMMPALMRKQTDLEAFAKIAGIYSIADPERSFEIIESGIGQINEVIGAGVRLDEFYEAGAVEQEEALFITMNKHALVYIPRASALMKNLAVADFERALALADKFERAEIRLFIRLRIAQAVLDPNRSEKEISDREQLTASGDNEEEMN